MGEETDNKYTSGLRGKVFLVADLLLIVTFILYGLGVLGAIDAGAIDSSLVYLLGNISFGIGLGLFLILAVMSNIDLIKEKRNNRR